MTVEQIVDELNDRCSLQTMHLPAPLAPFLYWSEGTSFGVEFMRCCIWTSDEDDLETARETIIRNAEEIIGAIRALDLPKMS